MTLVSADRTIGLNMYAAPQSSPSEEKVVREQRPQKSQVTVVIDALKVHKAAFAIAQILLPSSPPPEFLVDQSTSVGHPFSREKSNHSRYSFRILTIRATSS